MKKQMLAGILTAALGCCMWTPPSLAQTKLVYADYLAPNHPTNQALQAYFDAVAQDSKGDLVWVPHYASALLGPKDIPAGVRDGIADSGYFVGVYVPSQLPVDNYIGDFSMLNDDPLAMSGALNELVLFDCEECTAEYENNFNTKFLATYATTDYHYQCKEHLSTVADFKGKRVRGFSAWTDLARKLGAIPISVSSSETYEALQRGIIDCAMYYIAAQKTDSFQEVAPNVLLDSLGGFMGGSMINLRLDKWKKLTPGEREILVRHLPRLVGDVVYGQINRDNDVRKEVEAKGTKFYHASPDLDQAIKDFRENYVKTQAVEKGKGRGVKHPQKIADEILKLRAKWDDLLAKNGRDKATFERLLWEQVFSKVSLE